MAIESINPATGQLLRRYDAMPPGEVDAIVCRVHEAFVAWRQLSLDERVRPMRAAANLLRSRAEQWARLMAQEMGKPLRDGLELGPELHCG